MRLDHTAALRFSVGTSLVLAPVLAFVLGSHIYEGELAAQGTSRPARLPLVDEYYPVKNDFIADDRSILTIRHQPTGSCYILVYPAGDVLMPVEKERCGSPLVERQ